jgi:peptidoglycan/xylan/chitin deacetylase (PgdA/CDA1 family)
MTSILHPLTAALTLVSPAGRRAKLSTLIYHRVLAQPDPLLPDVPDVARFDWQMSLLARHFNVLPLAEAGRLLREGRLPARAACITFDDGYADNYTTALPILQHHALPATFFVATGFLDGGRMFNDTLIELVRRLPAGTCDLSELDLGEHKVATDADRRALIKVLIGHFKYQPMEARIAAVEALAASRGVVLPNDLMMSTDQLRALHGSMGVTIGGHTCNHPILAQLDADQARDEIVRGKEALETTLNAPIQVFAYPNGRPGKDYRDEHVTMVRDCGFELAVSTTPAPASASADLWQIPRFTPWDQTPARFALRMLRTLAQAA